jgi:hypothetical protein
MSRKGNERNYMIWHGIMTWHGKERHNLKRKYITWKGKAWHEISRKRKEWNGMARKGKEWKYKNTITTIK